MKIVSISGHPGAWLNFYGEVHENFKAGEFVILYSPCYLSLIFKQIRNVYDRGNGSVLVDLK